MDSRGIQPHGGPLWVVPVISHPAPPHLDLATACIFANSTCAIRVKIRSSISSRHPLHRKSKFLRPAVCTIEVVRRSASPLSSIVVSGGCWWVGGTPPRDPSGPGEPTGSPARLSKVTRGRLLGPSRIPYGAAGDGLLELMCDGIGLLWDRSCGKPDIRTPTRVRPVTFPVACTIASSKGWALVPRGVTNRGGRRLRGGSEPARRFRSGSQNKG